MLRLYLGMLSLSLRSVCLQLVLVRFLNTLISRFLQEDRKIVHHYGLVSLLLSLLVSSYLLLVVAINLSELPSMLSMLLLISQKRPRDSLVCLLHTLSLKWLFVLHGFSVLFPSGVGVIFKSTVSISRRKRLSLQLVLNKISIMF